MCAIRKPEKKNNKVVKHGYREGPVRLSADSCWRSFRCILRTAADTILCSDGIDKVRLVSKNAQANQQERGTEVATIDASINDRSTTWNPLGIQGFRQLTIAPPALKHPTLYQPLCHKPPLLHHWHLGSRQTVRHINRYRASPACTHHRPHLNSSSRKSYLESILAHHPCAFLYLHSTNMEARNA